MRAVSSVIHLLRSISRLAAPVALARLGIMGMGITDTVVVGQLAPDDLSALSLGWAPSGVLLVTGIGLLLGVQVLTARAVGEQRPGDAGAVWRRGLVLAIGAGVASAVCLSFFIEPLLDMFGIEPSLVRAGAAVARILAAGIGLHFGYVCCAFFLEGIKRPVPGTLVIWAANLVNLSLNLLLVPSFGARGAAWSTVGARAFMFVMLAGWIIFSPAARKHGIRHQSAHSPSYRALLAVGTAAAVSQLAEAGAFSTMTILAGRLGAQSIAAYQLLLNLLAVMFMLSLGVAAATAVLVGEAWGSRHVRQTTTIGWVALGLNSTVMIGCAGLLLAGGSHIAAALTSDHALREVVIGIFPLAAIALIPDGGQVVVASALRGRDDNWLPTASHVLAYVVVMPPLGWWLAEHLGRGVAGLMEAIIIASFLSVGVLILRLAQLTRATAACKA